jgi:hypothetical protein
MVDTFSSALKEFLENKEVEDTIKIVILGRVKIYIEKYITTRKIPDSCIGFIIGNSIWNIFLGRILYI